MEDKYKTRFSDLPWSSNSQNIILGGAGGIGSWSALLLSRAGHKVTVFDMDRYDQNNVGGQFCKESSIGQDKTTVTANLLKEFCGVDIMTLGKYDENSPTAAVMICAFDNMKSRKVMYDKWKEKHGSQPNAMFVDPRMTAEYYQIFTAKGGQKTAQIEYEKTLFEDSEVEELPCNFKATSHCGASIGADITGIVNNFCSNRDVPSSIKKNFAIFDNEITF